MSYSVVHADLARDRESILDVWRRSIAWFTRKEHERRLAWYQHNPCGPTRIFLARHDQSGRAIGTIGLVARHISVDGKVLTAGCVVDVAVNAEHRSLQPALLLAEAVADCLTPEMPLLWGHPNDAAAGVVRRAGFRDEGQGEIYIRKLKLIPTLRQAVRAKPRGGVAASLRDSLNLTFLRPFQKPPELRFLTAYHPALERLLESPGLRSPSAVIRTPEFLCWVYEHSPYRKYVMVGTPAGSGRELRGAAFCYAKNGIAFIDDLVYHEEDGALDELLSSVIQWACTENSAEIRLDVVNAGRFLVEALARFHFVPERARPLIVLRHPFIPADFWLFGGPRLEPIAARGSTRPCPGWELRV